MSSATNLPSFFSTSDFEDEFSHLDFEKEEDQFLFSGVATDDEEEETCDE